MTIEMTPEEFRRLGYAVVDMLSTQLTAVQSGLARPLMPDTLSRALTDQPLPEQPTPVEDLLKRVQDEILPYPMGNQNPRFFAWVNSTAAPLAVLGEFVAAAHNASVAGGHHAATYVEHAVLNWLKEILTYPRSAGALLTSGGSVANLIGLATMRHVKAPQNVRTHGLHDQPQPLVVYASTQAHSCIQKSVELLGFGSQYLRRIPANEAYQIDVEALKAQIHQDRVNGLLPVCVAASAGTVNTGAVDPLDQLADLCAAEGLWLHVDGAYGGVGILDPDVSALYKGIERADSIAIDPHKWLYMPIECGCALVKDAEAMRAAFSLLPDYLRNDRELPWFSEYGVQQTRGFKALKLWLVMQQIGVEGFRHLIGANNQLAALLAHKITQQPDFELVSGGPLSIVCFRYVPSNHPDVDGLNAQLPTRLQQDGRVFITGTRLKDRPVLRMCIVNFRTTEADLDLALQVIREVGAAIP